MSGRQDRAARSPGLAAAELRLCGNAPIAEKNYTDLTARGSVEKIDALDSYVMMTPEYGHGYPGGLKNAIDHGFALLSCAASMLERMDEQHESHGLDREEGGKMPATSCNLDDFMLGRTIGWAWSAGPQYAIGYDGQRIDHGEVHKLALEILNCLPVFALGDGYPSPDLLAGLEHALEEAHDSGLIQLSGDDYVH